MLSNFIQLLVLVPSALSCYLPIKNSMKLSMAKTAALVCGVLIPFAFAAANTVAAFGLDINLAMLPAMIAFFFIWRTTVRLDLAKALAVYVGVCAVQTFPAQFATIADMYLGGSPEEATVQSDLLHLGLSCLVAAAFIYPSRKHFFRMVDELDIPKIWYSVTALSAVFLIFNIVAAPASYDVIRESRLQYLFPAFEICALALLVIIYVMFYRGAIVIIEHVELENRFRLLEMQESRFCELQEYMKQTERLRHDFRHSVHILASLAEKGDIDGVRAHIDEYESRLSDRICVNYCANSALNALFGYYREMAEASGIKTDWRIELPEPLTVSELDMAALFGNIMENAIYACTALPEGKRYFSLTSEIRHGNSLYIVSTNSFDGKTQKSKDGKYRSTKHSGQGTGLSSIAAAAEKYGGSANFYNSETEFYMDVVLKL